MTFTSTGGVRYHARDKDSRQPGGLAYNKKRTPKLHYWGFGTHTGGLHYHSINEYLHDFSGD